MKTPLLSKNAAANEFRAQANALRAELLDATREFTPDEVQSRTAAIATLEQRAQMAAEFTPDAEIARQGGDAEVRADNPAAATEAATLKVRADQMSAKLRRAFGSTRNYLAAINGKGNVSEAQRAVLAESEVLTRAITGTTNGGEFLLPLSQVAEIFSIPNVQPGMLTIARSYNVPGRTLRIPYLVQDEGTSTLNRPLAGKIANVGIIGEGVTKPVREPTFGQRLLTVFKYAAITQVADEMLDDDFTGEMPAEFVNAVGQQAVNALNEHVTIDGGGTTEPVGALNAANTALLAVNRANAGAIGVADIFAMYERHTLGPRSAWMVSRRCMSQLFGLTLSGNTLVTYLPNLTGQPGLTLLGLPVIVSDFLPTLGSKADIALVNPDFYAVALRQALTVESSRDYAFVNDLTTYRFVLRGGGIPIPTSTFAYKVNGAGAKVDAHSPFVVLDVVASS
jgi:HK97 family phage major capsid protein